MNKVILVSLILYEFIKQRQKIGLKACFIINSGNLLSSLLNSCLF